MKSGKLVRFSFASAHFLAQSVQRLVNWFRSVNSQSYVSTFKIEGE